MRMAIALTVVAVAAVAWAVAAGELQVGLVVIVPILYGGGPIALVAVAAVMAAGVAWFAAIGKRALEGRDQRDTAVSRSSGTPRVGSDDGAPDAGPSKRHGGVVLLGPIPIVWGSDPRTARTMVVLAIVLMLVAFVLVVVLV